MKKRSSALLFLLLLLLPTICAAESIPIDQSIGHLLNVWSINHLTPGAGPIGLLGLNSGWITRTYISISGQVYQLVQGDVDMGYWLKLPWTQSHDVTTSFWCNYTSPNVAKNSCTHSFESEAGFVHACVSGWLQYSATSGPSDLEARYIIRAYHGYDIQWIPDNGGGMIIPSPYYIHSGSWNGEIHHQVTPRNGTKIPYASTKLEMPFPYWPQQCGYEPQPVRRMDPIQRDWPPEYPGGGIKVENATFPFSWNDSVGPPVPIPMRMTLMADVKITLEVKSGSNFPQTVSAGYNGSPAVLTLHRQISPAQSN